VIIIASSGGSSKPHQAITPSAPPAPSLASATTPTTSTPQPASPPAVSWLGMELTTVPPGGATVETVKLGSVADKAGLSPGEVILAVDGHQVSSAQGIAQAISGKHAGDQVQLEISHGSADYQTEVTLGAPPTRYP
jgi:S1-C subfamily serine protease